MTLPFLLRTQHPSMELDTFVLNSDAMIELESIQLLISPHGWGKQLQKDIPNHKHSMILDFCYAPHLLDSGTRM